MNDQALAQALKEGDFAAAGAAAGDYRISMQADFAAAETPERRATICAEAIETLQNHLHLARVLRAHLAAQMAANAGSCLYALPEDHDPRWQVKG